MTVSHYKGALKIGSMPQLASFTSVILEYEPHSRRGRLLLRGRTRDGDVNLTVDTLIIMHTGQQQSPPCVYLNNNHSLTCT